MEEIQAERAKVEEDVKAARARSSRAEAVRAEHRQRQLREQQQHDCEMARVRGDMKALVEQVGSLIDVFYLNFPYQPATIISLSCDVHNPHPSRWRFITRR